MKKKLLVLMLCVAVCATGCSGKGKDDSSSKQETQTEVSETGDMEETSDSEDNSKKTDEAEEVQASDNDTSVFVGSDSVVDVTMGACVSGEQKKLCVVKMPTNYYMASLYMDENGQSNTMLETDGRLLADIAKDGSLANSTQVPATIVMTAQGDANNSYTFAIVDSATISVESEKNYAPGGIDINVGGGHDAYAYTTTGQFDVVLVYEINDDWTLLIENSGQLKDTMSLEGIGQEFYDLVTPIG